MSDPHNTDSDSSAPGTWHAPLPAITPEPTYAPAALALGVSLGAWGVMTHWIMTLTGAALAVWALAQWFGAIRSDWRREEV